MDPAWPGFTEVPGSSTVWGRMSALPFLSFPGVSNLFLGVAGLTERFDAQIGVGLLPSP